MSHSEDPVKLVVTLGKLIPNFCIIVTIRFSHQIVTSQSNIIYAIPHFTLEARTTTT